MKPSPNLPAVLVVATLVVLGVVWGMEHQTEPGGASVSAAPPPVDAPVPPDAGACGVCPPERPHCDEGEGLCVECEEYADCTGSLTACVNGRCVACVVNADCPSLALPECYIGTHACRACTGDDACHFREGTPRCVDGACAP